MMLAARFDSESRYESPAGRHGGSSPPGAPAAWCRAEGTAGDRLARAAVGPARRRAWPHSAGDWPGAARRGWTEWPGPAAPGGGARRAASGATGTVRTSRDPGRAARPSCRIRVMIHDWQSRCRRRSAAARRPGHWHPAAVTVTPGRPAVTVHHDGPGQSMAVWRHWQPEAARPAGR